MLILGIDPGTAIMGYGLVEQRGSRLTAINYGVIRTASQLLMPKRLEILYDEVSRLILEHQPDSVGVEELFFNRNVTTALSVGQARGVVLLAAAQAGLPVQEYTPLQVKQSVVGYGKADKKQVIYMVQRLLNLSEPPHPDDAADALGIAICALHSSGQQARWLRSYNKT